MTDESGSDPFDQLVGLLNYPMFVVTTRAGDELGGCLVGFTSQVSIRPSRFLVGLSKRNHTYRVGRGATHLAAHLLPRRHRALARLFGSETGDRINKFDRCAWRTGPEGLPVLVDAIGWFAGRIINQFDVGDHVGFLLDPVAGHAPVRFDALVTFSDVRDLAPGHEA
jgi:flavin reductase (DIM6/NTAB) family NADH-FMN oxidoreductase RutF